MELNDWKNLLKYSRSTRGYDESRKVRREELEQLVDCARFYTLNHEHAAVALPFGV